MWDEHAGEPFPARLNGEEIAEVDLVMVDADASGCVSSWLASGGSRLDRDRLTILRTYWGDLARAVPLLTREDERRYVERVRGMAGLVLAAHG
jgi:hypothetical protein